MILRRWVGNYNQIEYGDMDAANKCRAEVTLSDAVKRDHGPEAVWYPCVVVSREYGCCRMGTA